MFRRQFLQQAGVFAGGLILNSSPIKGFAEGSGPISVGVIGCGDRGKGIMSILLQMPELFTIKAVCDVLDFRLAEARKMGAFTEFTEYRRLLDNKNISAVVIAVPLNLHYAVAIDALAAGKHVYLEKTMTYDIPQALDLVAKARMHSGQVLQVGHQYRYSPLYFRVKEMIEKNYLGKVTQIDCRWDRNGSWRRPVPDPSLERKINWRMYKEYSGGLAAELLSHQIDFINWAFNTHPDEVMATGGIDFYKDGRETYDNVQAVLRYQQTGMVGNFGATCANAHEGYVFKIKGTKGMVSLLVNEGVFYPEPETKKALTTVDGVTGATKIEWNKDGGIPIVNEKLKDGTWYAFQDFFQSISKNRLPASNVFTGVTTACCVHLANQALYGHAVVKWSPDYNFL
ncbi:Gfo/Idh/MocA family oxidoreductase [Flavitalea sp. BT771]|uniref:Gfo/Idh/MocA family protein n=1 Tax=Flavitalea sp. BT771 TaxID=3063329 RepID=UPI0026E1D5B3|nr:Gfo/Idh/MocA family oxidoreductase [Flavitalea sp. BT771]MDO6429670.1 Gfo/Idh/MocA family oxidoreductase [Flavitalea sp. BT771]MDV6218202.1 Gfo/Idh/MocA family oxidoreductase [Flavitalea sp. BT771]